MVRWAVGALLVIVIGGLVVLFSPLASVLRPPSPSYHIDPGVPWKQVQNHVVTVSYPATWTVATDAAESSAPPDDPLRKSLVTHILSPGFAPDKGNEATPQTGVSVTIYSGYEVFPAGNALGLIATTNTVWLTNRATLQEYTYEGSYLVLTATVNGVTYQMVMAAQDSGTLQYYRAAFLQIAAKVTAQ